MKNFFTEVFSSGPLQILGYALAIFALGAAAVFIIWLAKKLLGVKKIGGKLGDKELSIELSESDKKAKVITQNQGTSIESAQVVIDQNVFLEIVKDAAYDAFLSAQKRIELKNKVFDKQYRNAWQILHTFILNLSAAYGVKSTNKKDSDTVRFALEAEFYAIMKDDFEGMFHQNHFWKINDSQLEVRIKALVEAICAKLQLLFIKLNIDNPDVLRTVFDLMKDQLYVNISQIMTSAKQESAKYRKDLNSEIELNYARTNNNLKLYGINKDLEKTEKDKEWEEEE